MNTKPLASIGIDIGKEVFHVVGFGTDGKIAFRRKIKRLGLLEAFKLLPPSIVGMEACLSAHFVSRALRQLGHQPRIIPAIYVKPFVKGQKTTTTTPKLLQRPPYGRTCAWYARRHRTSSTPGSASGSLPPGLAANGDHQSDPCLSDRARHRGQDWGGCSAELAPGNPGESAGPDIAANARSDGRSLRRLDTYR